MPIFHIFSEPYECPAPWPAQAFLFQTRGQKPVTSQLVLSG